MLLNVVLEAIFFLIIMSIAAEYISRSVEILEHRFGAGFVGSVILEIILKTNTLRKFDHFRILYQ